MRPEQLLADLGPDYTERGRQFRIAGREETTLSHLPLADRQQLRGGADHRHLAFTLPPGDMYLSDVYRRYAPDCRVARQCQGILNSEVARRLHHE